MLISIHVPKTAGSSFRGEIKDGKFGRYLLDNDDLILSRFLRDKVRRARSRAAVRLGRHSIQENYDIIHGHFLARKYLGLFQDEKYLVFLREPNARLLSQYYYWAGHVTQSTKRNSLYLQTIARGATVVDFARTGWMRNLYARMLAPVPLSDFFFIGITERFTESLRRLGLLLNIQLKERRIRTNPISNIPELTEAERAAITEANKDNAAIYKEAVELFENNK